MPTPEEIYALWYAADTGDPSMFLEEWAKREGTQADPAPPPNLPALPPGVETPLPWEAASPSPGPRPSVPQPAVPTVQARGGPTYHIVVLTTLRDLELYLEGF